MKHKIKRLRAVDEQGQVRIVLAITPIETVNTYHGLREQAGALRHELNDGTGLKRVSDSEFATEPDGTKLTLIEQA